MTKVTGRGGTVEKYEQSHAEVLNFEAAATRVAGHRVGCIVVFDERGLHVDYAGNPHGPVPARLAFPMDAALAASAAAQRRSVLLAFEGESSNLPIVVGLLHPVPPSQPGTVVAAPSGSPAGRADIEVDGKRRLIEASEEIVLRCGGASITLRRDGRLVVRGAYVETSAIGTNRIKGGAVRIN